jgi:glyoxylase-like metal-dependent hydrolase (beta-lactamase superfamily II)
MKPPLAPLVDELPDGVFHAELPTPFPVGPVNCWLLAERPVTLVDPGMAFADSAPRIEAMLANAGLELEEVERVVATHAHPDHFGLAGWVVERSGAKVLCGRAERPKLIADLERTGYGELLASLGIPESLTASLPDLYLAMGALIHPLTDQNVEPLDDGQRLDLGGRRLEVHVTPGHATGHVSLWDPTTGTLCSGDHLLPRITPNPVLEPDPSDPAGRRRSLVEYLASLDRFAELDPAVVLPGHGPAFTDVQALVAATRRHHEQRAEAILELIRAAGPLTPFELSGRLFSQQSLEGFGVMLGVSEVIGHLDLLVEAGDVVEITAVPLEYEAA